MDNKKFNFAIHPGKILEKYLKNTNMTQKQLADKINVNKIIINEIIKGKRKLNTELAVKLEKVFQMPAKFWSSLQMDYDEAIIRLNYN